MEKITYAYLNSLDFLVNFDEEDEPSFYAEDDLFEYQLYSRSKGKKRFIYFDVIDKKTCLIVNIGHEKILDLWDNLIKSTRAREEEILENIDLD